MQDTHGLLMREVRLVRAPDEGGEVGAGASASLASRVPLPVNSRQFKLELSQASARLDMKLLNL